MKLARNDPCPCGSAKKYKHCCLNRIAASASPPVDEKAHDGAIGKALVYAAYVWLAARAGAVFATQTSYFVTGSGVLWAMLLLGERFSAWVWAALVVMLVGLFLVQPRQGPRPVAA